MTTAKTTFKDKARIFLTDYASYNNGTQFEFGHWVDLANFDNAEELQDYIAEHFKEADEKSPIDEYTIREEPMFTDFEGFPKSLYSESLWGEDLQKIFDYLELDLPNEDDIEQWLSLHNEYCQENGYSDDEIFENDEDFFEMFFSGEPEKAVRASFYGDFRYMDPYVKFDGYGNLESLDEYSLKDAIDQEAIINWKLENL